MTKIAILGAGISGLACVRTLADQGLEVTVFEKSRGVGGRMATRRSVAGLTFDHGAQYFTVRDDCFRSHVESWVRSGIAALWDGTVYTLNAGAAEEKEKTTPRFVGVPGMNAVCRKLGANLPVVFRTEVAPPRLVGDIWQLSDVEGTQLGSFDWVVISVPAPQAVELLAAAPDLAKEAATVSMDGCWAAMLSFEQPLGLPFDAAFVHGSPLSWVARNESKPGRPDGADTWVLHASADWTREHLEDEVGNVLPMLIDAFRQATGATSLQPLSAAAHRWRFAIPANVYPSRYLFNPDLRIAACGDWCGGPRVEGAFLSGLAAARRVCDAVA